MLMVGVGERRVLGQELPEGLKGVPQLEVPVESYNKEQPKSEVAEDVEKSSSRSTSTELAAE